MTAHKQISITCDVVPGQIACDVWPEYYGTRNTIAGVREQAATDQGWTTRGGKDYCPEHSKRRGVSPGEETDRG